VDEHVGAALLGGDEAVTLLGVEELHDAVLTRAALDRRTRTIAALAAAKAALALVEAAARPEAAVITATAAEAATTEAAAIPAAEAAPVAAAEPTTVATAEAAAITATETTTVAAAAETATVTAAKTAAITTTAETAAIAATATAKPTIPHSKSFHRGSHPPDNYFPWTDRRRADLQGAYGQVRSMSGQKMRCFVVKPVALTVSP
jgi:hypothetical protein